MQKFIQLVLVAVFALCATNSSAQEMTRKEKCAIKKEIRSYMKNPEKWVAMMDEHADSIESKEEQIAISKAQADSVATQNAILQAQLMAMMKKYEDLLDSMPSILPPNGTVYQVQMGYFKYLDLVSFNNRMKVIKAEEVGGAKRYVIGYFEDVMAALQFASDMKALGIDDAFVTQYVDGQRNMKFDALDEISR